jgi:pyruvate/2-oxoglutarate dehydrogenase complex dihydrolipoamide acyltransferase (E2) component
LEFQLPSLSADIEYGTVSKWLRSEGDRVEEGEPIVDVEVDKVTETIDAPASGLLVEIVALEGDEVKVGGLLAVIEGDPA